MARGGYISLSLKTNSIEGLAPLFTRDGPPEGAIAKTLANYAGEEGWTVT